MATPGVKRSRPADDGAVGPEEKESDGEHSDGSTERTGSNIQKQLRMIRENPTELDLSAVRLYDFSADQLVDALKDNVTVRSISFSGAWASAYTRDDVALDRARMIVDVLKRNKTLREVDFTYNKLGPRGATLLAKALKRNKTLKQLTLVATSMGDQGIHAFAKALKGNTSLEHLDISDNPFGDDAFYALMDTLKMNQGLRSITLAGRAWKPGREVALVEALKVNKTLRSVCLSQSGINDDAAFVIADALKTDITLEEVDLSRNKITKVGAGALADALKANTSLKSLSLEANKIGKEGAESLAKALRENRTLESLILSSTNLGPNGVEAIAKALMVNTALTEISLSNVKMSVPGAIALADALQANQTLRDIDLGKGSFGQVGLGALVNALKVNKAVQCVSFAGNTVEVAGAEAIAQALMGNKTLLEVDLTDTRISNAGAYALAGALKKRDFSQLQFIHPPSLLANTTLLRMTVSSASMGADGRSAFAEVLKGGLTKAGQEKEAEEAKQDKASATVTPASPESDSEESDEDDSEDEVPPSKYRSVTGASGRTAAPQKRSPISTSSSSYADASDRLQQAAVAIEQEFQDVIGQQEVKTELLMLASEVAANELRRSPLDGPLRMIFYGPPGTGKTTVARKMFNVFTELGLVPRSKKAAKYVERSGNELRGEYIGKTAPGVREAFKEAKAGILFLDECHQLNPKEQQGGYDKEALTAFMSESGKSPCHIILAGYPQEVRQFLKHDPGMARRFLTGMVFHFKAYTEAELAEIFKLKCEKKAVSQSLSAAAEKELRVLVTKFPEEMRKSQNAGLISNWLTLASRARDHRVMHSGVPVTVEDPRLYVLDLPDLVEAQRQLLERAMSGTSEAFLDTDEED